MKRGDYVPDRGDVVWLDFTPQTGHEQRGRRPALVVSSAIYNRKTNLALFCPITSKVKGYPFEVKIRNEDINGVILADQIKSLDWKARKSTLIYKAEKEIINRVMSLIESLLLDE
ncbi:MAG: endoribonuclease MazF [bacterium]